MLRLVALVLVRGLLRLLLLLVVVVVVAVASGCRLCHVDVSLHWAAHETAALQVRLRLDSWRRLQQVNLLHLAAAVVAAVLLVMVVVVVLPAAASTTT